MALCAVLHCTKQAVVSGPGTGSDTPNSLYGAVVYTDGTSAVHAIVRLRPADYVKGVVDSVVSTGRIRDVYTDTNGHFAIDSVDTGMYAIEINHDDSQGALIRCHFLSDTTLHTDTLKPTGAIVGTWETFTADTIVRYVQILGLDRLVKIDTLQKTFAVTHLPQGTYSLRIVSVSPNNGPFNFDSIQIITGQATAHRFSPWKFSRKIGFNTTSTGANVAGNIVGFPVLVRLNVTNFTFGQAKVDGSDVRFAKADNTLLPYEIERWDATKQLAEIWVKVDTVYGNDSSQSITMYWGNTNAGSLSNSNVVFDATNGFSAVWHLDNTCSDATGNAHNGTNYGAITTPGNIGSAEKFSGTDSIVVPGLLGTPGNVTLSAWFKADTLTDSGQEIVSIGDAVLLRGGMKTFGVIGSFASGAKSFVQLYSGQDSASREWHFVAFTFNNGSHVHSLYIDGALVDTVTDTRPINYANLGTNTHIGAHGNGKKYYNSYAAIDEVRVCHIVRNADWMKLSYMNQKTGGVLVQFK
jgi:hypothetical protein